MLEPVYAVIIDAGSTGSRVLALAFKKAPGIYKKKGLNNFKLFIYTYYYSFIGGSLELEDELFVQVKPGLSSFADDPKKVNIVMKLMYRT